MAAAEGPSSHEQVEAGLCPVLLKRGRLWSTPLDASARRRAKSERSASRSKLPGSRKTPTGLKLRWEV